VINYRPTWAEINCTAIEHNITHIKKLGIQNIMAVVKANAYGHGILEISQICAAQGIDYLGVATLDEAIKIREAGIVIPILILGYTPARFADVAIKYKVAVTVFDVKMAYALSQASEKMGQRAVVHLKIDTGMGRLGFACEPASVADIETIAAFPGLYLEGIFTHFAVAESVDKTFTKQQIKLFTALISELEKLHIHFSLKHCANSAAIIGFPETYFNMVRAGLILYGLPPSEALRDTINLIPAMELKSQICSLKWLHAGQTVSYGCTYTCHRDTLVAVIPIGYADGYPRTLSNKAWAVIQNKKIHSLGNICMDQCMFDVTDIPNVNIGDEVLLFGEKIHGVTADDLADIIGTINYEIVCSVGDRVPRVYIKHN
jgi:alanine racemase